ncbi:MAG: metallophosphoesterase [Clostridia bacterium]|nr:metallophosphoesterase [Clostridia bacterium]
MFNPSEDYVEKRIFFSEEKLSGSKNYYVLIISDLHMRSCNNLPFSKVMTEIQNGTFKNQSDILFCAVLGDITTSASENEFQEYIKFKTCLENNKIKVFEVPGNHDFFDEPIHGENYRKYVRDNSFYRVIVNNHSFYFLDNADGYLGNSQLKILESEFKKDKNVKTVFAHNPFYTKDLTGKMLDFQECAIIANLLSLSNVDYYFCGHTHVPEVNVFSNYSEVILDIFSAGYVLLSVSENGNSYSFEKF